MLRVSGFPKIRHQRIGLYVLVFLSVLFTLIKLRFGNPFWPARQIHDEWLIRQTYPLTYKHVHQGTGVGGAWYIPPSWIRPSDPVPSTILEAAQLAKNLANDSSRKIPFSNIPLIIHQTWGNTNITTWSDNVLEGVEKWLSYATSPLDAGMAYFVWLDDGCEELIKNAKPGLLEKYKLVPLPVERSDIFRIVVVNTIGGIYGDIDTLPLRSPTTWLDKTDHAPWEDPLTGANYSTTYTPTSLIVGIEADNLPDTDTYWRIGYIHPLQLTQWALASAPHHPILDRFVSTFSGRVEELSLENGGSTITRNFQKALKMEDPICLTGPGALTVATRDYLQETVGLRWLAISGREDGGRSKAVDDTLILPITGFSPGRPQYNNMGSKPITDPEARLVHVAQGSWRKKTLKVEYGKFCRTVFGLCKDWARVPE